jgi:co-chaperonin GroES (HSP10)
MSNMYDTLLVPTDRLDDVEPMDEQLVVKVAFPETKTKGGILLTDNTARRELAARIIGTVLKCGPNVMFFKPGDEVIYAKYAGTVIAKQDESQPGMSDGYEIRILKEDQIICKLNKKGA